VLRVAKVRAGRHAYYLEVATGPGGTGIEAPGEWLGTGSATLGLGGVVEADALGAVLRGDHPGTGERLGRWHDRVSVAGFDLSFCAPKSVSLLHALGGPVVGAEVRAAHDAAVTAALGYVEQRAVAVRRGDGGVPVPVAAAAVASAGFVHRVSRALDPHLHSHVVMANLGRGPEGSFTALDGRGLYAHAAAAGALYHAQLRHELSRRLGVTWEPLRAGRADVAGIGAEARLAFSQRAVEIARHLSERGLGGGRARAVAAHATRPARDPHVSADDLRPSWERRARAAGLSPGRLEAVLDRVPRRVVTGPDAGGHALASPTAAADVVEALGRRSPTATRRDVVRAWCGSLPAGAPAVEVEAAADRLLGSLPTTAAHAARAEGRGVGERRHVVGGRVVEQTAPALGVAPGRDDRAEHAELGRLLARRGMELPAPGRHRDRARSRHEDLGMGLG